MKVELKDIPSPGDRYVLGNLFGFGVYGKVYSATDRKASNKTVAIKVQKLEIDTKEYVEAEYKVLRDLSSHANIVDFYGIYKSRNEIWFVLEACEGGTAKDLANGLLDKNRRMREEHLAYILKETIKALIYLQENRMVHRDVKGSNILLTKEGEVKLCDFGLSKRKKSQEETLSGSIGSPCWMAPELIETNPRSKRVTYDERVDVWSIGITCIELGDGRAPFQDMHPTRALFQIARNPPPTLQKLSHWSGNFHDFISECLVKNYRNRPYMVEIIEHPFLGQIPDNNYHLTLEIKSMTALIKQVDPMKRPPEVNVHGKLMKRCIDEKMELMYEEDLAALHSINENDVIEVLKNRALSGDCYTFIGDILLFLNPNTKLNIYGKEYHQKYHSKSRSDNAPHVYSIADTVYQNALHHNMPQRIVLLGETGSGKTTNYLHLMSHLFFLGENTSINTERITNSVKLIHSLIHAATPWNSYSTRAIFKTSVTYGRTGKLSGASFKVHCLEKWRISTSDDTQGNFQFLYYMYDGLVSKDFHTKYKLNQSRRYRFLRPTTHDSDLKENIRDNVKKFKKIVEFFEELDFTEEQMSTIFAVIAAILNLGEARFKEKQDDSAALENREAVENFAELLDIDEKKMCWALTNYLVIKDGNAIKKRNSCDEAREVRDVLANTLYARLVDYIVNSINGKLSLGKAIFGAKYFIHLLDYFGFECFKHNTYSQLLVNCFNEQMHYHYLQRVFAWEAQDLANEDIKYTPITYHDNKDTLNELLGKADGVLSLIDDTSKKGFSARYISDNIYNEGKQRVTFYDESKFTVVHYTGKVTYSCKEMPEKNRDFLPHEVYETMRGSQNSIVSLLFTNKLDKTGNLIMHNEEAKRTRFNFVSKRSKEKEYSQVKQMRTQATIFRSLCLNVLKELSIGSGSGGTHFVKCIRTDLQGRCNAFHKELVRQQIRAMNVVQTAKAKKYGYPQRISFSEFLRRYKFLAFDFDENVDMTRDNCRLLFIRLKMEGWVLGKTKVCLKYYNEEYLSRLYEIQVRKIIKIQSILRGFLTQCRMKKQIKEQKKQCVEQIQNRPRDNSMTEDEAAEVIQKAFRKAAKRKVAQGTYRELKYDEINFIRPFADRWRNKSVFSVLMRYRAAKLQDLYNFSQQVHLYNMNAVHNNQKIQKQVNLRQITTRANVKSWIGDVKTSVLKLSFRLEDIPFYDTSFMCDYFSTLGNLSDKESWDMPYRWRDTHFHSKDDSDEKFSETADGFLNIEYNRDPDEPILELPNLTEDDEEEDLDEDEINKFTKNVVNKEMKVARVPSPRPRSPKRDVAKSPINPKYEPVELQKVQLRKVDSPYKFEQRTFNTNSAPANKDFEYIKPTPVTVRPKYNVDPIAELRTMSRKESTASDDEPPFNFQGMLRKTNIRRDSTDSLRGAINAVRRFSLQRTDSKEVTANGTDDAGEGMKSVSIELLPGLVIEGIEADL